MSLQGQKVGDYQLQECIKSEGFVETYLASSLSTNQQATIKISRTDLASATADLNTDTQYLLSEANALGQLNHPNILLCPEFGSVVVHDKTLFCLITPVRQEKTLAEWLQERSIAKIAPEEVMHIVDQAAEALEYTYKHHILHPPITSENLILQENLQNPHYPRLFLPCKPAFSAPEAWKREHDLVSDQYALAALAYTLLTGHSPSAEPLPPSTFISQLSQGIDHVFVHALAKNPEDRFHIPSAFARAFHSVANGKSISSDEPEIAPVQTQQLLTSNKPSSPSATVETALARHPQQIGPSSQANRNTRYQRISSPSGRWSLFTFLLIALAGCFIIVDCCIYYTAIYQPGRLQDQATATAQGTATAQAQATATFTSFQDNFDHLTANSPTFRDFDTVTSPDDKEWLQDSNPQGSCNLTSEGYHIRVNMKLDTHICFNRTSNFSNFVYQVQMQMIQGDASLFLFREDPRKGTGYVLALYSTGFYSLDVINESANSQMNLITGMTIPVSPKTMYQVAIVAMRNNFSIYLNGSYVNSTRDNASNSLSGVIGLGVATNNSNTAEVVYTQVQVWQLPI